jgi:hypothetical protein
MWRSKLMFSESQPCIASSSFLSSLAVFRNGVGAKIIPIFMGFISSSINSSDPIIYLSTLNSSSKGEALAKIIVLT